MAGDVALPSREEVWALLCEWTPTANLRKHMLAVEAAMRGYARRFGENETLWGLVGLLHDFDYERFPSQEAGHPFRGVEHLRGLGYPDVVCRAILSHADYSGVPRTSRMELALHACDELTGFVVAVALVRPARRDHAGELALRAPEALTWKARSSIPSQCSSAAWPASASAAGCPSACGKPSCRRSG